MEPMVAADQHHAELQHRDMGLVKVKALSIISLLLLLGCAPSTHDLIEQAHLTGDWSLVNQRYAAMEKREQPRAQSCPRGTTLFCTKRFRDERCGCVSNADIRDQLSSLDW
jgi:hypothetical protein